MSKIREIIEKYFNSDHPEDLRKNFFYWFRSSRDKDDKDAILKDIWDGLNIEADESTERSFETFQSRIPCNTSQKQLQRKSNLYILHRVAAVLLVSVISATIMFFIMKANEPQSGELKLVECIVPKGEIRTVILPDLSVVKINSGSILVYPQQFSSGRDVYLVGEAYFSVVRNEHAPFTVKTTDMDVEVLGTVFNVSAYGEDDVSSATLESGKVNVKMHKTKKVVSLAPNEEVVYNRTSEIVEKRTAKIENTLSWINGELIIQSMTMEQIANVLERKYGVEIYLNSNKFKHEKITMRASKEDSLEVFMSVLKCLVPQLRYKIEKDKLYIY